MASPEVGFAYSNLNTGGNAKVHAGNNYNSKRVERPDTDSHPKLTWSKTTITLTLCAKSDQTRPYSAQTDMVFLSEPWSRAKHPESSTFYAWEWTWTRLALLT
jgi:hypothetical protein